jgi:capsular exopolysaccharide synthesis family protein
MKHQHENGSPNGNGASLTPQVAGTNNGLPMPTNRAYPVRIDSEGFEAGPPALAGADSANVAGMVKAIRHRWLLATIVGLVLGSAAGAAMWFLKPVKYTAFALLRVAGSEHRLLEGERENDSGRTAYMKTQAALITSPKVLQGALGRDNIKQLDMVRRVNDSQRQAWLEKELKVGYLEDTELLRISLTGTSPKELADLVNAIQDTYLSIVVKQEQRDQLAMFTELEQIFNKGQDKLRRQRTEIKGLAGVLQSGDPQALTTKQRITFDEHAAAKREVALVKSQLRQAETRLKLQEAYLKSPETSPVPDALVDQQVDLDPSIVMQMQEVARAQASANATKQSTSEGSPLRIKTEQALNNAETTLKNLRTAKRPDIVKRLRERGRADAEASVAQTKQEIAILTLQKAELEKEANLVGEAAERIGTTSLDLEMKKQDIEQIGSVVKLLGLEKEKLEVELQATARQRVRLLQEAETPETPNIREHIQESVLAGLCAMSLGVFLIGFREFRARWVNTEDEVTKDLGMRVVGTLPDVSNWAGKSRAQSIGTHDQVSVRSLMESIDSIRTVLSCSEAEASTRVLMITSAVSREGKTMLAAQLAASFAHSGKRTLLVDFDLRNPSLHRLLALPQTPGVSEVLRGEIDFSEAVQATDVPGLSLLSAGVLSRSVLTTCLQESGEALFEQWRSEYHFIVIDSCPVLPVSDSLVVGQYADAAVFSIRPRVSRFPAVVAASEKLRSVRIPVLGTVVNGVRKSPDHENYRYYTQSLS